MLKYIVYVVAAIAVIGLAAGAFHLCRVNIKNKKEMAPYMNQKPDLTARLGKVLVVYYSLSGNTKDIAQRIKTQTNADLYEITSAEEIKAGASLYRKIKKQLKTGKYPAVKEDFPNFSDYDIIFVGSPVWWYTAATPVLSFLEKADFKGKKVVPFATQGSNPGAFDKDFAAKVKNAVLLEGRKFNNLSKKYDNAVDNKITVWLNGLN